MWKRLLPLLMLGFLGCGGGTPQPTADDAAIQKENTEGRQLRGDLEGIKPTKKQ